MGALIEVNTDGLAKLAETVGGWFGWNARAIEQNAEAEAYAAVRKVDAENAAALIKLQGEDQLYDYIIAREKRKMLNTQNVVKQAQQHFIEGEQVSDEPVNQDWINRFFTIVEDVSDAEMQQLWARILAGEVKNPKSYSLRTLEVLRNMTKEEAEQITKASQFVLYGGIICSEDFGINLDSQSFLDEIGLICGEEMLYKYSIPANCDQNIVIDKKHVLCLFASEDATVKLRHYTLTKAGKEIFTLTDSDKTQFITDLANYYKKSKLDKISLHDIQSWDGASYTYSKVPITIF